LRHIVDDDDDDRDSGTKVTGTTVLAVYCSLVHVENNLSTLKTQRSLVTYGSLPHLSRLRSRGQNHKPNAE